MRRSGFLAVIAFVTSGAMGLAQGNVVAPPVPQVTAPQSSATATTSPAPMLLWPGGAPGAQGSADEDKPTLTVYLPASNPTKTAVVIAPGGGYQHLSMVHEGSEVAAWLNARGVAAFVLKYRLGMKYHNPIELEDAQRAIRTVRARAADYGVVPDHIGMWGFSAGGHLTASAGTHFDAGDAASSDAIEQQSSRPDFLILAYPVITLEAPYVHKGSRLYLLGQTPEQSDVDALSAELHVTAQTPPTFLFSTTDDRTVPVMNSVMFYEGLVKAGVPAEMHIFQHGGHGSGLAPTNPQLSPWTEMLIKGMRERGYAAEADAK
jgi:acetyl esterase/lipase